MTRRHRRDFLLDSGGISALAGSQDLLVGYIKLLEKLYDGALLIPIPVLTEVRSGQRDSDALVDRLVKAIGVDVYVPLSVAAATRAGALRTEALRRTHHIISPIDAQLVAIAEERSRVCAVTIITGDPRDINLLVELTHRTNIAVDVPGWLRLGLADGRASRLVSHWPLSLGVRPRHAGADTTPRHAFGAAVRTSIKHGEGGIRTLERGFPRYAISSRARSTAPAPLQALATPISDRRRRAQGYDTGAPRVARLPACSL